MAYTARVKEQTAAATWARMLPKLRRDAQRLLEFGWEVKEPPNVETPPHKRGLPLPGVVDYSTSKGADLSGTETVGTPPPQSHATEE